MFQEIKQQADLEWEKLWSEDKLLIMVGAATCGRSAGALNTKKVLEDELSNAGIESNIIEVGCMGPCYAEPLIYVKKPHHL